MYPKPSPTWPVASALLAALALLIAFEYRSLSRLRQARVVEQAVALARFAEFIRIGIDEELESLCDRVLDVPLAWLERDAEPLLASRLSERARGAPVAAVFAVSCAQRAAAWAVASVDSTDGGAAPTEIAPSLAMRAAAAPWLVQAGCRIESVAVVASDHDPALPVLVRPLADADRILRGVAGVVLDPERFAQPDATIPR